MAHRKKALVCFDGLNLGQFEAIQKRMPQLTALMSTGPIAELDSTPFSEAHPIWSEILTGQPWYRNGCAGYAKPLSTLNQLKVITERDLNVPIQLFNDVEAGLSILINTPIVQPLDGRRIWLSDGVSSFINPISPGALLKHLPFRSYAPKPVVSMGQALANGAEMLTKFLDCELNKLQCALALAERSDWTFFLYRSSIFDQLSHLLGAHFIEQQNLAISARVNQLLTKADEILTPILRMADDKVLFSSFSHVRCEGIFSINDALEQARLLARTPKKSGDTQLRLAALAAAQGGEAEPTQPTMVAETMQYLAKRTLCASPVRGNIYLNTANRFEDGGKIDDMAISNEEHRIAEFFESATNRFGSSAKIFLNPERLLGGPNFVFLIDGIELVESLETTLRTQDLPLSTHSSRGFVWSPKVDRSLKYRPLDLHNVM
ncbi:hypothetical protein BH10CYA1_BH10CYA1_55270 [soil metagenome]